MRDGHIRVLPLHVANKIAAGEVVERPASVVKELLENAIDAGAKSIRVTVTQGGRKLVAVQDDGCGMTRDDAVLSFERQATSKIQDVDDIEKIDTLGFRGEAIPSIASVSRFTLTTRRADSDEGTRVQVNAGTLAEVNSAGCPPGTLVEVRDLFCNVPARRKFLRAYVTEESHVKSIFTIHALAHPSIAFSLTVDGRELYRLAPSSNLNDRVRDLFGDEFVETLIPLPPSATSATDTVRVTGFIERPNRFAPTRREQFVFVNGRPATAPSVAYALREAYPRQAGDTRPATILFIDLPPAQVDVNVHPTKREVRFRDNAAVKNAVIAAIERALREPGVTNAVGERGESASVGGSVGASVAGRDARDVGDKSACVGMRDARGVRDERPFLVATPSNFTPQPAPVQEEIKIEFSSDGTHAKPWAWFKVLAQAASGYLLVETDSGIVTINPVAARERIAYEKLLEDFRKADAPTLSQALLIPETVRLSPADFTRVSSMLDVVRGMGFQLEEFGTNVFKVDAVPQLVSSLSPAQILATVAHDLSEDGAKPKRANVRWREELIAKSIARSFAGASFKMTNEGATKLVEELARTKMPYVCPRGKPIMIFTSTRELNRKFDRM